MATDSEDDEAKPKTSVLSSYMVGEDGAPVSRSTMDAVRQEARLYYFLLLGNGKAPHVWGEAPIDIRNELLYRLETAFPFLRYCENHWKAKKVATNSYSQWKNYRTKKMEVIDVDTDDEETLKRPRGIEGDVAGPSKRARIEKTARTSSSGPRPTKTNKQRKKVCNISVFIIHVTEIV